MRPGKFMAWPSRLLLVVLLGLLSGLGVVVAGASLHAHAAPAATLTVTDCSGETGPGRIGTVLGSASAGDTITFSCSGTIPITSTLTISTNNLTIDGSGQTVTLDGGSGTQVLFVNGGVTFTLKGLTIAHGFTDIFGGGGLENNGGTVTISNSTFANNSATGQPGFGGGLNNNGGTMTISNSTFANNSASGLGGGLMNGGTLTISNSTFANNSAATDGGGLQNNGGTLTISNSTIAGNSVGPGALGGGLQNSGTLTISNSTIANNSAVTAGFGGGLANSSTLNIKASIVANNSGGNCDTILAISDQGNNLSSDSSCGFTGTGSLQNTGPKLGPLASNGGPTQTLALLAGSPAIDAGPVAGSCPTTDQRGVSRPDNGESTCDIGAYEFQDPVVDKDLGLANVPSNFAVDATSPQGATVTYTTPTAADESGDTSTASLSCTPASGSTFAIGTTTVTCTASDSDDSNSPVMASFTVTVNGAATQVNDLISVVQGLPIASGLKSSLDTQLQTVQADLSANNTAQACSDLTGFINHVNAQSGKGLTTTQASNLLAAATNIEKVLAC